MNQIPQHIYLCGFMGSGKTTVGKLLAEKLGYKFVDTDQFIEKNEKTTIRDIFENSGETQFRKLENRVIKQIAVSEENTVIALGGGSLMRKANLKLIKTSGYLIYLNADRHTIAARLQADTARPLLQRASLDTLFKQRKPGYETASLIMKTRDQSPAEIVQHILHHFSRLNKK